MKKGEDGGRTFGAFLATPHSNQTLFFFPFWGGVEEGTPRMMRMEREDKWGGGGGVGGRGGRMLTTQPE